ncbi:MAG TPA: DUF3047 domain-containing protein [Casimicrobiaceae bacterium]|nr:DUF3047 domain-containing protein [Casimicrobiaceae bacterium]
MLFFSYVAMRGRSWRLYGRATRSLAVAAATALLSFAALGESSRTASPSNPVPFSALHAGAALAPWTHVAIAFGKRETHYDLIDDDGTVVLHAVADNAASALAYPLHLALHDAPILAWRWKVAGEIPGADPRRASREDAPARVVLEFDGDSSKLPLVDRAIYGAARHVAGRELPYATLMYIFANREGVGTVIPNPHTRRIQMIVVSSGASGVGRWQSLTRNVHADFVRAFGEEPGTLTAVGVLTDSDNTDGHAEAWYGDIRFEHPH